MHYLCLLGLPSGYLQLFFTNSLFFKKENITGRTTDRNKLGASKKILVRKTGSQLIAAYEDSGIFPEQSLYFLFDIKTDNDLRFLLGILNSKLLNFFYQAKSLTNKESIAQIKKNDLDRLPIPLIDLSNPIDKARHNSLISKVEQMLSLHQQLITARTNQDKTFIQQQIEATDQQINKLVFELYELTEQEIAIVESAV